MKEVARRAKSIALKLCLPKHWFLLAIAAIALTSLLLYWRLQDPEVNAFHPNAGSLWQPYYWVWDNRFGYFGLENWRLEGSNTETAVYFGRFHYSDVPLSAPAVAAIGFAAISVLALLGIAGGKTLGTRLAIRQKRKLLGAVPCPKLSS